MILHVNNNQQIKVLNNEKTMWYSNFMQVGYGKQGTKLEWPKVMS